MVQWSVQWSRGPMVGPMVQWSNDPMLAQRSNGRSNGPMVGPMEQWANGPSNGPIVQWSAQWPNGRSNGSMVGLHTMNTESSSKTWHHADILVCCIYVGRVIQQNQTSQPGTSWASVIKGTQPSASTFTMARATSSCRHFPVSPAQAAIQKAECSCCHWRFLDTFLCGERAELVPLFVRVPDRHLRCGQPCRPERLLLWAWWRNFCSCASTITWRSLF